MTEAGRNSGVEQAHILLGLLDSVERDGAQSQRRLASELGIALGLVNAYLNRSIKKGLVKVSQAPARRYAYYLTPKGFAEKSRLTVSYLSSSFSFFRRAKADCLLLFAEAAARGCSGVVLAGMSDLAEIAAICALESKIRIVAVVDPNPTLTTFMGVSVVPSFEQVAGIVEAVIVTDLATSNETFESAIEHFGSERVWVPALLGLRAREPIGKES